MAFTREYVLMYSTAGRFAFEAAEESYMGGSKITARQVSYGVGNNLLVVEAPAQKRRWVGAFFADDTRPGGTVSYGGNEYTKGNAADLEACLAAADLEVLSFEDAAFWYARCVSDIEPVLDVYSGAKARLPVVLLEK